MMSDETGKTKEVSDPSASNQRMLELLQKVAGIAEAELAKQPESDWTAAWCHLSAVVANVREAMRPEPGTLAFMDELAWYEKKMEELRAKYGAESLELRAESLKPVKPRETPLDPNAPEMVRGEKPDGKKAIGDFAGVGKVVSYAIDENIAVTVTARKADGRIWMFKGIKQGETVIMGTILGGRATAARYCKFIRNGIVSRFMKIKRNHTRRAEDAAAALAGARSDAGKAVAE